MNYRIIFSFLAVASVAMLHAGTVTVTTLSDDFTAPVAGSLREAINTANADPSQAWTINFNVAGGGMLSLAANAAGARMLPIFTNPQGISINGANGSQGVITIDGGSISSSTGDRIFFVGVPSGTPAAAGGTMASTTVTSFSIANLTLQNANARGGVGGNAGNGGGGGGGLGGAIYVNAGQLSLSNVIFLNNLATGGAGGSNTNTAGRGGGGGGMGGNGGASSGTSASVGGAGGGGFGLGGNGGNNGVNGVAGQFTGGAAGGNNTGTGQIGGVTGGGGAGTNSSSARGGGGGVGGTNGQLSPQNGGGNGAFGGGGGGAGPANGGGVTTSTGGNGGFGGGGGGGSNNAAGGPDNVPGGAGGTGGFGGGGGGHGGLAGFGGGGGAANNPGGGGGGLGAGGAVFVRQGATLTITDGTISGGVVVGGTAGTGGTTGSGIGQSLFLAGSANYSVSLGNTITITDTIGGGTDALISGGFTKSGAGTLNLTGANTYTGDTAITQGILGISTPYLADAANVLVSTGTTLNLTTGATDTVNAFYIDGIQQAAGTWGGIGSGANFETILITGTGKLNVTAAPAPEPASTGLLGLGVLLLAARRRRVLKEMGKQGAGVKS